MVKTVPSFQLRAFLACIEEKNSIYQMSCLSTVFRSNSQNWSFLRRVELL